MYPSMYVECTLTLYVNLPTFTSGVLLLTNKHFLLAEKLILVPCNINSILARLVGNNTPAQLPVNEMFHFVSK